MDEKDEKRRRSRRRRPGPGEAGVQPVSSVLGRFYRGRGWVKLFV